MATNMEIATIIKQQLGGNRFVTMTGAANFTAIDRGLQFSFKGCRKANKLIIRLDPDDTYTMEFCKYSTAKLECKTVETRSMVYAAELATFFTSVTGLDTHL